MIRSACTRDCPDACSVLLEPRYGGCRVQGNPEHPVTDGRVCAKVRRHLRRLTSPSRVTMPRQWTARGWRTLSWSEALETLCSKLQPLLAGTPQTVLHMQGHGSRGISKEVCARFFSALGCSGTCGSLCDGTGIEASIRDFGALEQNDILDLEQAERIVNWGRDLSRCSPHLLDLIQRARRRGAEVVSIWPGGDGFEGFSDRLIRIAPGQDRFLALAVIKLLQEKEGLDAGAVQGANGAPAFFGMLEGFTVASLCERCGVDPAEAEVLASIYARPPAASILGWGLQRYAYGGENVRAVDALAWLSGSVGRSGGGVFFNVSSSRHFDLSWIPAGEGRRLCLPDLAGEIRRAEAPRLSLAWIAGSNPVNQAPDSRSLAEALRGLDFVVVAEAFMTDTAECADLILPSTLMWEEEEVLGSCMHDFLQHTPRVFDPPAGARSDLWVVQELDRLLGRPVGLPDREACFAQSLAPASGATLEELKSRGFVRAGGPSIAYARGTAHPGGRFSLLSAVHSEPPPETSYPLRLLSLIRREATHSQILPEEHRSLPKVWVNPRSPEAEGCTERGPAWLVSERGRIRVEVRFDLSLHPEAVITRRGEWRKLGGGVNSLIGPLFTDMGPGAAYYDQRVRLEAAEHCSEPEHAGPRAPGR